MIHSDFHPAASREQFDLLDYFENINPATAQRFQLRLDHALTRIEQVPRLYPEQFPGVRIVSLNPHFGEYYIAYMIWNGEVIILAIGHAKRRPFYFADRVKEAQTIFR